MKIPIYYYVNLYLPNIFKVCALTVVNCFFRFKAFVFSSHIYSYIFRPFYSIKYSESHQLYTSRTTLNILGETDKELYCVKKDGSYYFFEQTFENHEKIILVEDESLNKNLCQIFGYGRKVFNESFVERPLVTNIYCKSNVGFLSIEYSHSKLANHLDIVLDKRYLNKGSQILSPLFVSRYLAYEYGTHTFFEDMDYTLSIIDNYLNIFTIDKNKIIILGDNDYEIVDRRCAQDTITMS